MRFVLLLFAVICSYQLIVAGKAHANSYVKLSSKHKIEVINSDCLDVETVFDDTDMQIYKARLSATSKYLAWRAKWALRDTCLCEDKGRDPLILVIMDLESNASDSICHVGDFSWSPVKDQIVYIKMDLPENDYEFYSTGKVWIDDVNSGTKQQIFSEVEAFRNINWQICDNKIYTNIAGGIAAIYNPLDDKTAYKSYDAISPDGIYGFCQTVDAPAELYITDGDQRIELLPGDYSVFKIRNVYAFFLEWGVIEDKTVVYVDSHSLEYIDCATGRMYLVLPPSPDIDPLYDLVGFRDGRPVWAKIHGDKAELFYYQPN
ncbi:MAG: hypothetical protein FVQ81_05250 [Candidatus Glassbacteria bacterium]|nr:hypothetical protein [Candidatus Glassbacteria bacterium]